MSSPKPPKGVWGCELKGAQVISDDLGAIKGKKPPLGGFLPIRGEQPLKGLLALAGAQVIFDDLGTLFITNSVHDDLIGQYVSEGDGLPNARARGPWEPHRGFPRVGPFWLPRKADFPRRRTALLAKQSPHLGNPLGCPGCSLGEATSPGSTFGAEPTQGL